MDKEKLTAFLTERFPDIDPGSVELARHPGGHSCETWRLRACGHRWILRRPPRAHVQRGASNMAREFRVMKALAGSEVPVPAMVALCEDPDVIGAPFLIMEEVDGVVIRDGFVEDFQDSPERRAAMGAAVVDTLVALHRTDYRRVGLTEHGRPEGFLQRNLRLMEEQWRDVRQRDVPAIERLSEYLPRHIPDPWPPAIVHGDYKLDNIMWRPDELATVAAVVDWEVSTIADPRVDLGWLRGFWSDPSDTRGVSALAGNVLAGGGFPDRDEIVDRYSEGVGRRVTDLAWFEAFAMWKIAIIMEASYKRYLSGASDDPLFAALDVVVPLLAEAGLSALSDAGLI
ncbi:MAG: phosphotransferase family protein [Deltaproteobacteria bacterium]|nr:MAG: phosphotransferase family protein [Deltaproteobacteria bacterium]